MNVKSVLYIVIFLFLKFFHLNKTLRKSEKLFTSPLMHLYKGGCLHFKKTKKLFPLARRRADWSEALLRQRNDYRLFLNEIIIDPSIKRSKKQEVSASEEDHVCVLK